MTWKEELDLLLKGDHTDSDVMDFADMHPDVTGKEIWNFVYEYDAPAGCKGCEYVQRNGLFPCTMCSRKVELKDYYKSKEKRDYKEDEK